MRYSFFILFSIWSMCSFAQGYVTEAFRIAEINHNSTPRSAALSNAGSALGGDLSAYNLNPAGLGIYRSAVVSGSFSVNTGITSNGTRTTVGGNHLGFVYSYDLTRKNSAKRTGLLSVNVGFSSNNIQNNRFELETSGINTQNSRSDLAVLEIIDNGIPEPNSVFHSDEAIGLWQTRVIDTADGFLFSEMQVPNEYRLRFENTNRRSSNNLAAAVNISNKLYLGTTINFERLRSSFTETYSESANDTILFRYEVENQYRIEGTGIQASLGFVYRVSPIVRIGASIYSPTRYTVIENSIGKTSSERVEANYSFDPGAPTEQEFSYKTPYRVNTGFGFIVRKKGFIAVDYGFTDYRTIELSETLFDPNFVNDSISIAGQLQHRIKIGAELNLKQKHQLRIGGAIITEAYKGQTVQPTLSAGYGYRGDHWFFDVAAYQQFANLSYNVFEFGDSRNDVNENINTISLQLGLGYRF